MPTERYFTTPDTDNGGACSPHRIHYLYWKCRNNEEGLFADRKTVFCLHGLTRNAHDFDYIAEELSEYFNVVAVTMAGRGESEWLDDKHAYNYMTYAADCLALIEELSLKRVYWLGTSMGGIIAMMICTMSPDTIERLVLNDIGYMIPEAALRRLVAYAGKGLEFASYEEAESCMREIFQPFGIDDEKHWAHFAKYTIVENRCGDAVTYCFNYDPDILAQLREETDNFQNLEDIDLSAFWEYVKCPTLLLRGKESDILPENIAHEMAEQDNVTLVEFDNIGHAPALVDRKQINIVAEFFLKNL